MTLEFWFGFCVGLLAVGAWLAARSAWFAVWNAHGSGRCSCGKPWPCHGGCR